MARIVGRSVECPVCRADYTLSESMARAREFGTVQRTDSYVYVTIPCRCGTRVHAKFERKAD